MAAPILIVLKVCSDVLFFIVAVILIILDALLLPVVRPIRRALIQRQFRVDKAAWIAKNALGKQVAEADALYETWLRGVKESIGAKLRVDKDAWLREFNKSQSKPDAANKVPVSAFVAWQSNAQREYANRILEDVAADKVFLKEKNFERLIQAMGTAFLTPLHSGLVVGVVSLVRYSEGKDLIFDHAPLQQFGDAIAAARVRLSGLIGIGYISLRPLPSLFRVETHGRARFARSFFNLDVLIWGRYTNQEEQLAQAHIVASGPTMLKGQDNIDFQYQRAIFPGDIDYAFLAGVSSFTFVVDDPLHAHIVFCIGVLKALVRRHEKGSPKFLLVGTNPSGRPE
jgi:hypothetical protein